MNDDNAKSSAELDKPEGFVSSYLLYLLAAASEAASAQFHDYVRTQGLRVPEWRVLASLHGRDGVMITHLAKFTLLEQSRLTKIIDQMDIRGLVYRQVDKKDRRKVRIYLSNDGRKLSDHLVIEAQAHEVKILNSLGTKDNENLKPALQNLLASLEKNLD